eukprot:gnl/TRDRNA2_/TRDRNA2_74169_c0_seq1.p1 gnl/TRDRNA2_/TRDRNA2_74169_c0~~gnl/TRDRNA2_/TRDRNA2_74169_c0_seq1.p1  ORF type:complete len:227 (-),score=32.82 gnl/TRDRNA2_/TRDRNA2_74169_c0_seq1:223-903(-)
MAWIAVVLLVQAALPVHGDAHAECEAFGKMIEEHQPKASTGELCFAGSRRLGAVLPERPEQPHRASPFGRRLDGHLGMIKQVKAMCDDQCKGALQDVIGKCGPVMDPSEKEYFENIMFMCRPCGMFFVDMFLDGCDFGEGSSKVCSANEKCMGTACGMESKCTASQNPMKLMQVSDAEWKDGYEKHLKALESCPCTDTTTSAATKWTTASSFSVVSLLAFLVHNQQ